MTVQDDWDLDEVQKFSLTTSPMINYACSFQIKVGRRTRKYRLSHRGDYPLTGFLQVAIEAYESCVKSPGVHVEGVDP